MTKLTLLFLSLSAFFTHSANANITLKGEVSGSNLTWHTGTAIAGDYYVPFDAYYAQGQGATTQWIPGGLYGMSNINSLTLVNGGDNVIVPIELAGMQYGLFSSSTEGSAQNIDTVCSQNWSDIPFVSTIGYDCFYDKFIDQPWSSAYGFSKPILKMDEQAVAQAFKGAADGTYSVTVPLQYNHRWKNNSNVWTQTIYSDTLTIEIENKANELINIQVTQRDEITPQYDLVNQTVSGTSHYPVLAQGRFQTGLKLTLKDQVRQYELQGPGGTIPYSIKCQECETPLFVDDGQVINVSTRVLDANSTDINFNIDVYYNDIDLSTLQHGRYQDDFVLQFEPEI